MQPAKDVGAGASWFFDYGGSRARISLSCPNSEPRIGTDQFMFVAETYRTQFVSLGPSKRTMNPIQNRATSSGP